MRPITLSIFVLYGAACYTQGMQAYDLVPIRPHDVRAQQQLDALLSVAGIKRDQRLDYTVGLFDESNRLLATGSIFASTLRCLAVDPNHQGEGLLNGIVNFLIERQTERGYGEVFLYTKCETARFFQDLGFAEIARVPARLVFMSNRPRAFTDFLSALKRNAAVPGRNISAVVMNANPFTLGHLHLLERASFASDLVHCFVVSEDASLVPADVRYKLVRQGCAHLPNVMCHPTGQYMVSNATFPSYFLKDDRQVTETQARLDIEVFARIAETLSVTRRFVGEEPTSGITQIYNDIMAEYLPQHGIELTVLPRAKVGRTLISASTVRQMIHDGQLDDIRPYVPYTTYAFFTSDEGQAVVRRIQETSRVIHD